MVEQHWPEADNLAASLVLDLYRAALVAVSPHELVSKSCSRLGSRLHLSEFEFDLNDFKRVFVAGAGKASCGLAAEILELVRSEIAGGLVVTKFGHALDLGPVRVMEASHPVLDETSIVAGEAMAEFARALGHSDLVLFILSGGASSLMELPKQGVSLERIQAETRELLATGANIQTINSRRKSWSALKGGGLGHLFQPATVVCLVLSDVLGDDLATIGSGPLYEASLEIPHFILGNLQTALDAAAIKTHSLGYRPVSDLKWIFTQDARDASIRWSKDFLAQSDRPAIWIGGGEPVVHVRGDGLGGRCQEFAAAAAAVLAGHRNVALLAGSTDGSDGPTDNSGGLVTGDSVRKALLKGVNVQRELARSNSSAFLAACDGLIVTGPTQSNVNDVYLLART